ncbi:STE/STE20 protein kinase [Xylaria sp. FL0933]|nr:STE/STE20 protein kinase [Xylaria sp. FL0933]
MASSLALGQVLRGRAGAYTVSSKIKDAVWVARNQANDQPVIVKSIRGHPRVENERDVLKRFQPRSPYLRPLVDEIHDPAEPTTIVLRHLDSDLLQASKQKPLNSKEIKYVSKRVLEALSVMHEEGYVHTDVKIENIFVNYKKNQDTVRFSEVQLGDFGGSYPQESELAKSGTLLGTPMCCSPELLMETPWNTATDIWSFGALVLSLLYGGDFNPFSPKGVRQSDETYNLEVVKLQFRYFGPFPLKVQEIFNEDTLWSIVYIGQMVPREEMRPFQFVTEREVGKEDRDFVLKIMKMDWRDRPTAKELLQDEWFTQIDQLHNEKAANSLAVHNMGNSSERQETRAR